MPFLQDDDPVAVLLRLRNVVCGDKNDGLKQEGIMLNQVHDFCLGLRVDGRSGLIEDHETRETQKVDDNADFFSFPFSELLYQCVFLVIKLKVAQHFNCELDQVLFL